MTASAPRALRRGRLAACLALCTLGLWSADAAALSVPPTQGLPTPVSLGKGEGALSVLSIPGYATAALTRPFQRATGCKVTALSEPTPASVASSASRGARPFDVVLAQSDHARSLIFGGVVRPVNVSLIPGWSHFRSPLQAPGFNTVSGYHYGVTTDLRPHVLAYATTSFPRPPTSWSVLYARAYRGRIAVPDTAMQIADAALVVARRAPKLHVTDPFELTAAQFKAATDLLVAQRPLVARYFSVPRQEVSLFAARQVVLGPAATATVATLRREARKVASVLPREGVTAAADSWLLAARVRHPNCAYRWLRWVSSSSAQAQLASAQGVTPVNAEACARLEAMAKGACRGVLADLSDRQLASVRLWSAPSVTCDNGVRRCVPWSRWQVAWRQITR